MISIIVPVYKAEDCLNRCVDSILAQQNKDWELLLVDDGSPDNSGKICDDYAQLDSRIRVIHKSNGGVSSARNAGIDEAKGDWIAFVDADDCVNESYLNCVDGDYDIIFTEVKIIEPSGVVNEVTSLALDHKNDYNTFLQENLRNERLRTPWGKFFRRDLIGNNRFPLNQRVGEDTVFVYKLFAVAKRINYCNDSVYMWQNCGVADSVKYKLSVDDDIKYLNEILDNYEKIGIRNIELEKFSLYYFFSLIDKKKTYEVKRWFDDKKISQYLNDLYGDKLPMFYRFWKRFPCFMYLIKKFVVSFLSINEKMIRVFVWRSFSCCR